MQSVRSHCALWFICYSIGASALFADQLTLRNGQVLDGEVVVQTQTTIQFRTKGRIVTVQKSNVRRISYGQTGGKADSNEAEKKRAAALRAAQEAERKRTAAVKQEAERKRTAAVKQEAERKRAAEVKQEAERKRAAEVKQEAERKRAAEVKQEAERKRTAAVKQEAERKRAAEVKQEAERKRAVEVKQEAERKRAVEVKQEAERTRAAEVKQEAERKRAAEVKQEAERKRAVEAKPEPERKRASEVVSSDNQSPTAMGALWRSSLAPGWGAFYANHPGVGLASLAIVAGSVVNSALLRAEFRAARSAYDHAVRNAFLLSPLVFTSGSLPAIYFLDQRFQSPYVRSAQRYNNSLSILSLVYLVQAGASALLGGVFSGED